MICEICKQKEAVVKTYTIINGIPAEIGFCSVCGKMNMSQVIDYFYQTTNMKYEGIKLYEKVLEYKAKNILELGSGYGYSTTALIWGLAETNGKMVTLDIGKPWPVISREFTNFNDKDSSRCKDVISDSRQYDFDKEDFIDKELDILYIDTSHEYDQTLEELRRFAPYVKKEGVILLHDVSATPPVYQAAMEYCKESDFEYTDISHKDSQYGLGMLKRRSI